MIPPITEQGNGTEDINLRNLCIAKTSIIEMVCMPPETVNINVLTLSSNASNSCNVRIIQPHSYNTVSVISRGPIIKQCQALKNLNQVFDWLLTADEL